MKPLLRPPGVALLLGVFLLTEWWVMRQVPGLPLLVLVATALLKRKYAHSAQFCVTVFALYVLLNRH